MNSPKRSAEYAMSVSTNSGLANFRNSRLHLKVDRNAAFVDG